TRTVCPFTSVFAASDFVRSDPGWSTLPGARAGSHSSRPDGARQLAGTGEVESSRALDEPGKISPRQLTTPCQSPFAFDQSQTCKWLRLRIGSSVEVGSGFRLAWLKFAYVPAEAHSSSRAASRIQQALQGDSQSHAICSLRSSTSIRSPYGRFGDTICSGPLL